MTVIGEAFIAVKPDTQGFAANAEKGIVGSVTGIAKKAALAFGGAFAVTKGVEFFKGAIDGASDLAESTSKVEVVFGKAAAGVLKFADNSAKGFGQSKQQALEAVGTFGNLAVSLGVPVEKAADMSKSLTTLAADLASFNNTSVDEALNALRSGLSGETEPLKRYGVALDEATLKQKAMELGLIKSTKDALTPAAKAQASYAAIMDRTKTAQGDFARTSDGLANKQRILGAQLENIKTKVGSALIPVFSGAVSLIMDKVIPAFDSIGRAVKPVVDAIRGAFAGEIIPTDKLTTVQKIVRSIVFGVEALIAAFKGGGVTSDGFVGQMEKIGVVLRDVYLKGFVPIVDFVREHWKQIAVVVLAIVSPISLIIGALVLLYAKFDGFREVVNKVLGFVGDLVAGVTTRFGAITEAVGHIVNGLTTVIQVALAPIVLLWQVFGDSIIAVVKGAFEQVRLVVDLAIRVIRDVIDVVLNVINGDWGAAWDALKDIPAAALGYIVSTVGNILETLLGVVKGAISGIVGVVASLPGQLLGFVGKLLSAGLSMGKAIIEGIGKGLSAAAGFAGDIASSVLKAIKNVINKQVVDRINDAIPDSLGAGPFKISLPKNPVPHLAKGALVQATPGGIIANIGEGRFDEAVLPLPPGVIEGLQAIAAYARQGFAGNGGPLVGQLVLQGVSSIEAGEANASAIVRRLRAEAWVQGK